MWTKVMKKKNNAGFTLLEVLVAVIILAIISVPLLRAFATAAQTNSRAKIVARCTNAAENVAEDFRDVKADDLVKKYIGKELEDADKDASTGLYSYEVTTATDPNYGNKVELDSNGKYTFTIKNHDSMSADMPDDYFCQITLDPALYKNANELNLTQIEPVSIKDSAIFTMPENFDSGAYDTFVNRNKILGSGYQKKDKAWFKKNLTRTITFDIEKVGTSMIDPDGNPVPDGETVEGAEAIPLVKVTMNVVYKLEVNNATDILPASQTTLDYTTAYLYDNTTSKRELNSVYLFFYPRYEAALDKRETIGQKGRDRILVNNVDNIECNLYLTMLKGAEDEGKMQSYCTNKALGVSIVENPASGSSKGAITLRTNMNSGVPYSKSDVDPDKGKIYFTLSYGNSVGNIKKYDTEAGKMLSIANTDGKTLNVDDTPNRIYKMNVSVFNPADTTTVEDPVTHADVTVINAIVDFDGTKLEY